MLYIRNMKPILIISFLLLCFNYRVIAQQQFTINDEGYYAIIKDTDEYVNIRSKPNNKGSIIGKIYYYSVFNCEPNYSNWWKILQSYENDQSYWLEGYVNKSRVELLTKWQKIGSKNIYYDSCRYKTNSLTITIKRATFKPKKHKLLYDCTQPYLSKIDGKHFWGADGDLPKKLISSIKVTKNGIDIMIPKDAFSDLYEPNFQTLSICKGSENTFYIKMDNSDGAGGYTIIWIISDGKYYGRYIDTSFA